ncbi:MAG: NAD(P)/FAD-dependent oxidoreductase, partial [Candidatus Aenigmatarchaeota archaeon]
SDTPARVYLDRFVKSHPWLKGGSIIEANAGGIPVGGFLKKMTLDNFLVVGDAAHQVNPIHGGGIHEVQSGGKIAAEVAAEAIKKGDTSEKALDKYNKRWWKERGNELHMAERLREVLENLSDGDFDFLAEHLSGGNLIEFSAGKNLGFLAKLMLKRPHLIKHARALM